MFCPNQGPFFCATSRDLLTEGEAGQVIKVQLVWTKTVAPSECLCQQECDCALHRWVITQDNHFLQSALISPFFLHLWASTTDALCSNKAKKKCKKDSRYILVAFFFCPSEPKQRIVRIPFPYLWKMIVCRGLFFSCKFNWTCSYRKHHSHVWNVKCLYLL